MTAEVTTMLVAILPEIALVLLAGLVLFLDVLWRGRQGGARLGWVTAIGLAAILALASTLSRPPLEPVLIWGGMLRWDNLWFVFRMIFLTGAMITALYSAQSDVLSERGEFYALMLVSVLGMSLMAASANLITLYLAIETTSIPLYIMAGFLTGSQKSVESGLKYFLYGAFTSTVMLYGFSLLYGLSGSTHFEQIAAAIRQGGVSPAVMLLVAALILTGFGFKISAAPFHFWAPDVYEGAPTPVAGFLSTASKAAGFAVLMRFLQTVLPDSSQVWVVFIAMLSIASMLVGNFLALAQRNIKRLFAYSSIAQAGYILIGVAAHSVDGTSGTIYYLLTYLATNLAVFGIIEIVGKTLGSDELPAYAGLSRRSPTLALLLLVGVLSLGGIPPFAGFIGKLLVFKAAVESGLWWLALVGLLNSVVALYYYLTVLKVVYLDRSEGDEQSIAVPVARGIALALCIAAILVFGTLIAPAFDWSTAAAGAIFAWN
ncbi:MAG: NADH-quinone oxidoreductase subunit N [Chloroflexi bacterium]|nr:NADH-quinone oxidoreductase subunit N [Chloroflexota bacterium]